MVACPPGSCPGAPAAGRGIHCGHADRRPQPPQLAWPRRRPHPGRHGAARHRPDVAVLLGGTRHRLRPELPRRAAARRGWHTAGRRAGGGPRRARPVRARLHAGREAPRRGRPPQGGGGDPRHPRRLGAQAAGAVRRSRRAGGVPLLRRAQAADHHPPRLPDRRRLPLPAPQLVVRRLARQLRTRRRRLSGDHSSSATRRASGRTSRATTVPRRSPIRRDR